MANIPLQLSQRRLDTGDVVQYPGGGEVGRALEHAGNELSAVADAYQRKQDEMDKFKRITVENEFDQATANQADEYARNAPADGTGIHDGIVGEVDPTTGKVAKPGLFDNLAQQFRDRVPESQRPYFDANLTAKRLHLSGSAAAVQDAQEQKFAVVETTKIQDGLLNSILQTDPNDFASYDAYKAKGREAIEASPLRPLAKQVALDAWDQMAPKALAQAITAKDPGKLRSMLGMTPAPATGAGAVSTVVDKIIGVESGGNPNAKNPTSSASGVGQFLDSTWVQTIRQHRPDIAAGKSAAQIIALKSDPVLGREMTAAFTQDNADYLTNRGVATTPGNIYLAHFLGPAGAVSVLKADPNASIASVVGGDVVRANSFLAGKTVADTIAWSDKKMGGAGGGKPDPRLAGISPDDRLSLANADDVAFRQKQALELATAKADYTSYKDHMELAIVAGQVADPGLILGDKTLNDGDKATLLRSWESENKGALQVQQDLTALNGNALKLDPYASDDKTRADKLYTASAQGVSTEQAGAIATAIIQQTGVVPQPIMNDMRRGLSSQNPAQVIAAAQTAQKISAYDPAILGRRDGGSEVQKAADDFAYYVNKLNLPPEEAARRMIDAADPSKQRDRKALEPAAKEFVKTLADVDLSAEFKDGGFLSSAPALGVDPAQEAGIKADFIAMAEDAFYAANGDPALAKNRALEQMKTIYGVSSLSGSQTVVKYPPERYWPKQDSSGAIFGIGADPFLYAKTQLNAEIADFSGRGLPGPITQFEGRVAAGNIDLASRPQVKNPDGSISTVRSMSYQNDAGEEVLIPTVSNEGKVMTNEEAIKYWGEKGQFLGKFDTPEHATAYAEALHKTQEQFYRGDLAIDPSTVRLVTTPETEADVKAGRLPGYAVMWKDANGNLQTIPGKVWRPDTTNMLKNQQQNRAKEQSDATDRARKGMEINRNIIEGVPRVLEGAGMQNNPIMQPGKPEPGSNIPADIPAPADGADPYATGSPM